MNVLIVGGGIGGLTAALALQRCGHRVTLWESSPALAGVGAGIVLGRNAGRALEALGVNVPLAGAPLASMALETADGRLLQRLETPGTTALSRPALHALLAGALPASVTLQLGARMTALEDRGDAVEVWREGETLPQRFELLIGADGLHSSVRERTVGPATLRSSGTTCFRGVVPHAPMDGATEVWGVGTRVGLVPVEGGRAYYYLVLSAPMRAAAPAWPEAFRRAFAGYGGVAGALLETLSEAPPLHHDLIELDHPLWGRGRVLLLGDAAHGMTPNQGQGAAMAIEDALALPLVLADGAEGALTRYRALRHARVRAMQLGSRRLGAMAHWRPAWARGLRDAMVRAIPTRVAHAQLRRSLEPGIALAERFERLARSLHAS